MKRYVLGLVVAALMSGAALAVVLLFLNPFTSNWIGVTLLLISTFFLVASIFTLIGFTLRVIRARKEVVYAHLATALRQGLLLAIIVVGSLLLQVYRIFNIWSALLFVAAVVLVELAFQSHTSGTQLREASRLPLDSARGPKTRRMNPPTAPLLSDIAPTRSPEPWHTRFQKNVQLNQTQGSDQPVRMPQAPTRIPVQPLPPSGK